MYTYIYTPLYRHTHTHTQPNTHDNIPTRKHKSTQPHTPERPWKVKKDTHLDGTTGLRPKPVDHRCSRDGTYAFGFTVFACRLPFSVDVEETAPSPGSFEVSRRPRRRGRGGREGGGESRVGSSPFLWLGNARASGMHAGFGATAARADNG